VWAFRELLRRLVGRNLKIRYQRSALGFLWALLNPLAMIGIMVLVFGLILRMGVEHYWAFLASGYFAWVFTLHSLTTSTYAIKQHAAIARGVAVPADVLVLSEVAARYVEFLVEIVLVTIVLAALHHRGVPASFALLPVLVGIQLLLTVGLALPLAAIAVYFDDMQHALPVALMLLAYISLVFYPLALVPEPYRPFFIANPIAAMLALYHAALYEGRFPSPVHLGAVAAFAVLVFVAGNAVFRRQRALLAEIV
jgi:ABC-type polysaccharide/polyol phosphate export permease